MGIKLVILTFLLFDALTSIAQNGVPLKTRADSVQIVKVKMRQLQAVESYATGYTGQPSIQFQGFLFLLESLNNNELLELTKDSSGCLRVYAYTALVHNRYKGIDHIQARLLRDSIKTPVMFGCVGGEMSVSAIVSDIKRFYNRKFVNKLLKGHYSADLHWRKQLFES